VSGFEHVLKLLALDFVCVVCGGWLLAEVLRRGVSVDVGVAWSAGGVLVRAYGPVGVLARVLGVFVGVWAWGALASR